MDEIEGKKVRTYHQWTKSRGNEMRKIFKYKMIKHNKMIVLYNLLPNGYYIFLLELYVSILHMHCSIMS